jgi:serine/threonine protein kinase
VTDERWQVTYAIYEAAASLAEPERHQYVHAAAPDAEIAGKVLAMLGEMETTAESNAFPESANTRETLAPALLVPGSHLGPYEILDCIGRGGVGLVYRARDPRLDRQVAIKLLLPDMAADPQARERLRREALAAAALDHPFICKIFEIGEDGDALFLVMEYITGETLHRRLQDGRMPLSETLRVAGEMADALEEAHAKRLLHRDLKPSNIMITHQGHVKVMDFGLAKRIADQPHDAGSTVSVEMRSAQLTVPGMLLGTPDYMSPEQVKGLTLDVRSDLFSFGVILAEMISGRNPFRRPSMMETLSAVLRDSPDFGGDIQQGVTVQGLVVMARRMLAKDAAQRYASIAEMRADLARLAASSQTAAAPIPAEKRPADSIRPIGRDADLKQLTRQLEEALAGRGSLILIGGEPGIGKTHLASALLDAARSRGAFAVTGHCYEMEGSAPYLPFIEMLEHSARSVPPGTFRYALGDDAPEVAKLMPEGWHTGCNNRHEDGIGLRTRPPDGEHAVSSRGAASAPQRRARGRGLSDAAVLQPAVIGSAGVLRKGCVGRDTGRSGILPGCRGRSTGGRYLHAAFPQRHVALSRKCRRCQLGLHGARPEERCAVRKHQPSGVPGQTCSPKRGSQLLVVGNQSHATDV